MYTDSCQLKKVADNGLLQDAVTLQPQLKFKF